MENIEVTQALLSILDRYGWDGLFDTLEEICNTKAKLDTEFYLKKTTQWKQAATIIKEAGDKVFDLIM